RDAASAGRQRVNPRRAALTQTAQGVVDRQALEQIAADGVERNDHWRRAVIHGLQVLDELVGGDTPGADLAVTVDLDPRLVGLALRLDAVPVFVLHRRSDTLRLVENAQAWRKVVHRASSSSLPQSGRLSVL